MTTNAIVLDSGMEPLCDDMEIKHDDFSAAEQFAAEAAANGTKCCIQWSRSDDGQTAYWGPAGAVFKPHWYWRLEGPGFVWNYRVLPHVHCFVNVVG